MPWFKSEESGDTFEVSEEHAEEVLRKQDGYREVEEPKVEPKGKTEKKGK